MTRYSDRHLRPRQRNRLAAEIRAMIESVTTRRELPALTLVTRGENIIIDGDETYISEWLFSALTTVTVNSRVDVDLGAIDEGADEYFVSAYASTAGVVRYLMNAVLGAPPTARTCYLDSWRKTAGGNLVVTIVNESQQDARVRVCATKVS